MKVSKSILAYFSFFIFFSCGGLRVTNAQAQESQGWTVKDPFNQKVFIENKGQFSERMDNGEWLMFKANTSTINHQPSTILFGATVDGVELFFSANGLTYKHTELVSIPEKEKNKNEEERKEPRVQVAPHYLTVTWLGANPNAKIISEEPVSFYETYEGGVKAGAFKKITYKNLYPNIDVEYTFPKDSSGIKYSLVLHPGADPSLIKMKWNGERVSEDSNGNIVIHSSCGDFIDHAPNTFYKDGANISSAFQLDGNVVAFNLKSQVSSLKSIIIDPWTTNPAFTNKNKAYDVNYDYNGNVYAYGGWTPAFQLAKFNSAGVLQWKYNATPMMVYTAFYGDFTVDPFTGTSYLGEACNETTGPHIIKISTLGQLIDSVLIPYNTMRMSEIWRMDFNSSNRTILGAGGGITTSNNQAMILDTSLNIITTPKPIFSSNVDIDVTLCTIDKYSNGTFAYMVTGKESLLPPTAADNNVLRKVPLNGLMPSAWSVFTKHNFMELQSPQYVGVPTTGIFGGAVATGYNGIAVSPLYVYTYDSDSLKRWDKANGALIGKWDVSTLPLQIGTNGQGQPKIMIHWGGLDVDNCDNIYIGVGKEIKVYDASLNLVNTYVLTDTVYDLKLSTDDKLYACGRGFVTEIKNTVASITYSVALSSVPPSGCNTCDGKATVNASAVVTCGAAPAFEYVWSPGGQTNSAATGLCPGKYTVIVTDNHIPVYMGTVIIAGVVSANITSSPANCGNNNGSATASVTSGASPYTYSWSPVGGTTSAASGLAPGNYSVTITDGNGCSATVAATIAAGTPGFTATINSTQPTCLNPQGSATANPTGGISPFTFIWNTSPVQSTQTATGLSAGIYSVTITNAIGCTSTASVSIMPPPNQPLITTTAVNSPICIGASNGSAILSVTSGTSPYTYNWFPSGGTTSAASGLSAGTYTAQVTDAAGCTNSDTAKIAVVPPAAIVPASATICSGQTAILTASGGGTYSWNTGSTNASISVSPSSASSYSVITSMSGCSDTAGITIAVSQNSAPTVTLVLNSDTVCINSGILPLAGGSPPGGVYSGAGVSGNNFDPSAAGSGLHNIIYTYADPNSCSNSDTAEMYVDVCTGIIDLSHSIFSVIPNPSKGIFTISSSEKILGIEITNLLGEKINLFNSLSLTSLAVQIDLEEEQDGIYILLIKVENGLKREKLILAK